MAESYFFDKWDPEGPDYDRKTYNWDENTRNITPNPNGGFIHYRLQPDIAKDHPLYNDLYWNRHNGWIIYKDANGKNQVYKSGKTAFHHLNDSELDEIQAALEALEASMQQQKELQEKAAKEAATPAAGRVDSITIEPKTTTNSTGKTTDLAHTSNVASTLLQNLIALEEANETADKPVEDTVYYNYGPEEIDLKYYLHNLSTNLQAYMNSQNWNSAQRTAFLKAYEKYKTGLTEQLSKKSSRFTTDDAGILIDSIGALDGKNDHIFIDENGNTYNSLDEISSKKLRKTAIEFSPNDEVANYFNTIGQAVVAAGKTKKGSTTEASKAFDFNKNGFQNYWVSRVNPAGGKTDINPYLELDPVGADGKRQKTNRLAYLIHELQTYSKYIDKNDFNFEGTPFKSKKEYLTKIQNAIANLSNGWDSSDPASLQAVGITSDFYDYFLSDKVDPVATPEEEAAAKTEDEEKRLAIAKDSFVKKAKAKYNEYITKGNRYTRNHTKLYTIDYSYLLPTSSEGPDAEAYRINISSFFNDLGYTLPGTPGSTAWSNAVSNYFDALWKKTREALYKGDTSLIVNKKTVPLDDILPKLMPFALSAYFQEDSTGTQVDMNDYDGATGTVLCAKDGHLYFDWAFDHKESNTWLKLAAKFQETYDKVNSTATNPYGLTYTFQKGGEIKILKEGGIPADATPEELQAYIEAEMAAENKEGGAESATKSNNTGAILDENGKLIIPEGMTAGQALASKLFGKGQAEAKARHMSYAQYHAKQRSPNGAQSIMNPESGVWKAEDYARMGAILADITSLVLDPVSGAAVNVGSTATNFVADWLDDSVTAVEMWKNLGMNLGMDALSIIPIVGDAAGTGGKLLKSLKTIAPKLMYGLTAYGMLGTLKNAPNIMQSLSKVTSDEKLTVGDYQNIAQAITAVAGINSGVKSAVAKRLAKRNAKVDDAIGLGLRKKGTENPAQDVIFRGKHATELKKLVAAGKVDDVNAYLHKLEGFSNYEVNTNLASVPVSVGLPVGRTAGADGKKHWGVKSPFNVARKIDAFEIYDRSKLRSGYASKTLLNTHRQDAVEAGRNFKETDLFTTKEVDELQKQQIEAKMADAVAATKKRQKLIADVEARISGTKDADGKVVSDGVELTIAKTEAELRLALANVAVKQADLNALDPKYLGRKLNYKDSEGKSHSLSRSKKHTLDDQITKAETNLNKAKADTQAANDKIANDATLLGGANPEAEFLRIKSRRQELLNKQATGKLKKKEADELTTLTLDETRISKLFADRDAALKVEKNAEAKYNALSDWKLKRKEYITTLAALRSLKGTEAVFQNKLFAYNTNLANLRARLDRLKDKNIRTKQTSQLYDLINQGNPFLVTYGNGLKREVSNKDLKDIVDAAGLLKKGGNILKFLAGKPIDGIVLASNPGSWYTDIFSYYKLNILDRLTDPNSGFDLTINDMQRAHHDIYTAAGGSNENWRNKAQYSINTASYLTKYQNLGYNEMGISPNYKTRYRNHTNSERITKDSKKGGWQSDGYYSSITDDRRILGRQGDWNLDQIADFQNELQKLGFKMYLDPETHYYMIGKLGDAQTPSTKDLNIVKYEGRAGGSGDKEKEKPQNEILSSLAKKVSDFAPNPFEYLRYRLLNNDHKRSTEYAMRAEKPFLQTPLVDNVYIQTDLRAENEGNLQKAELMSATSRPMTSDAVRQMALIKDAYAQGQKYADAGMKASDQMLRTTMAADLAQRKENHKQEHLVGESNRLAARQSQENRDKIWLQYLAQKSLDRDNFLQQWEYDVEKKKAEKKAIEKQATVAQMQNAIKYQPNNYGAGLTTAELSAYNKVLSGTSTADLSDSEIRYFNAAQQKVADTITNAYYQYMGAPTTIYTAGSIYQPKTVFTPTLSAKDGAKLETAKLRAKIKNADRFLKSIEKKIDNLNKKLDRISKSMYGKPKLEMVK